MQLAINSESSMRQLGQQIGRELRGGEVFELIGDVGTGKTTFTKGLAEGLEIIEPVQSPTFTISRIYPARDNLELRHYDFYRLSEAGIMAEELAEALESSSSILVVEWAEAVDAVLPDDRLQVKILTTSETDRQVEFLALGEKSREILENLK